MKCEVCGSLLNARYCNLCGTGKKEKKSPKRIPHKSDKGKQLTLDDIAFFMEIWAERDHYSEVSGTFLGDEFNPSYFSHILTKAAYPAFRYKKTNIVLMTFKEHQEWEFTDRKHPKWERFRDLEEDLIIEYYKRNKL